MEEEQEMQEVNVGAMATGSGSNLFGVSGRLASWVRDLSSLRSRSSDDAAAEPLQPLYPAPEPLQPLYPAPEPLQPLYRAPEPLQPLHPAKAAPNGVLPSQPC
ncbi:unnamed protein product [Leptidea sinapis]|uniref:Uncharacterized protein n=1 Tax=Leptidea sinapis TaxID=189913 RepID=A0A5E4R6F9_9NEOP|nr:unnamed protein product [Leptidea sinapis]